MDVGETLLVETPEAWRAWLAEHHSDRKEIWLITYKKSSNKRSLDYEAALDEAVCFGWIDGQIRGVNAEYYVMRWSPRRPRGNWSDTNRARARRLAEAGRMTAPGLASLPTELRAELESPD